MYDGTDICNCPTPQQHRLVPTAVQYCSGNFATSADRPRVHRSLSHLLRESLHHLLHFETRGWHTLLDRKLRAELANPELLLFKLRSAASKLAFVLVPISLPFLWLMFLGRPEFTLYDHASGRRCGARWRCCL